MQFCDKINKGMARGHPRVLQTAFPFLGGGGTRKNRRHKRKGQKVGVLKGWEVGEIEGNGQYFAIKKGLK